MNTLRRIIFTIIATLGFVAPLAAPVAVRAQDIDNNLKCGAELKFAQGEAGEVCTLDTEDAGAAVDNIVENVINILSLVVGVAAVIMIIVGGLRYITSNGDSGQVGNAKNTILYAVVGLVVVALAQIIVRFIVGRATGTTTEE